MSKVSADTLKSLASTQDLTIGTTGQTVTLPGNELRVNTFKDKGGNTLWTSDVQAIFQVSIVHLKVI